MAREIGWPITLILKMPAIELEYWACVFQLAYEEEHPEAEYERRNKGDVTDAECEQDIANFKKMFNCE